MSGGQKITHMEKLAFARAVKGLNSFVDNVGSQARLAEDFLNRNSAEDIVGGAFSKAEEKLSPFLEKVTAKNNALKQRLKDQSSVLKDVYTNVNKENPLYGVEEAAKIRDKGVVNEIYSIIDETNHPIKDDLLSNTKINKIWEKVKKHIPILQSKTDINNKYVLDVFRNKYQNTGQPRIGGNPDYTIDNLEDKAEQSKIFSALNLNSLMPESVPLSELKLKYYGTEFDDMVKKYFGDNVDPVVRNRQGAGSSIPGGSHIADARKAVNEGNWLKQKNLVVSPKQELAQLKGLKGKFLNSRLNKKLHDKIYGGDKIPSSKEYRVHVLNGKVIPHATTSRWNHVLGYAAPPMKTKDTQIAERGVQDFLDNIKHLDESSDANTMYANNPRVKKQLENNMFAFDTGIKQDGTPTIFEINPTGRAEASGVNHEYGSGHLFNPFVSDAITSAAKGKTSKAQRINQILPFLSGI